MSTFRRVALAATILVVQFAAFEAGMRLHGGSEAAPEFQRLFMQDPRVGGHRLRPNATARYRTSEFDSTIAINSHGVRDDEFGAKALGEKRVVVLGDSLVLAVQVAIEETFSKRLQARLDIADPVHAHRVINAGVQGYGPVEEWRFYDEIAAAFEPDLVVVAVFVGNDALEAVDSHARATRTTAATVAADDAEEWLRRIVRRSMVLQTVRLRVRTLLDRIQVGGGVPERPLATYLADPPPAVADGLALTRDYVKRIADRAASQGARTAIVLVPARFQVEDGDFGRLRDIVAEAGDTLVRDAATDRFRDALAPLGLPMLDLLPVLRAAPDPLTLFFQENVHLTRRGHDVVAAALASFIEREGLL